MNDFQNVLKQIWKIEELLYETQKELPKKEKKQKRYKVSINDEILMLRKLSENLS